MYTAVGLVQYTIIEHGGIQKFFFNATNYFDGGEYLLGETMIPAHAKSVSVRQARISQNC